RDGSEFKVFQLDAVSGQPLPKTVGGEFFFTLHYDLHAGMVGLYIVGIAGMLMLVALVSGTIVHRRIFKDFFTLRPQAARQRAWLDAHNVLGVIGLPFHLMIAYTGLVIFIVYYMQAGLQVVYQNDGERFFHEVQGSYEREEVGRPAGPP
ncbi:PepSY-associated TM helix domain-containing protein, partial [Pseudomonas aeruginosa]